MCIPGTNIQVNCGGGKEGKGRERRERGRGKREREGGEGGEGVEGSGRGEMCSYRLASVFLLPYD